MRTLYIECNMGVAGDMLMGALLELIENKEEFIHKINNLGIPDVKILSETVTKCGIGGTHVMVQIDGREECDGEHLHHEHEHHHKENEHHHHTSLESIEKIIEGMNVSERVQINAKAIYRMIAEAESKVHGKSVSEVHFHEVGMMDAIADIAGCCMLIEEINPEKIIVSPITTGFGEVYCSHGIMPVPAPATALLLNGIPNRAGKTEGELCTPTGTAIVKYFGDEFGYQPQMITEKVGYGMGTKDFEKANCVRAFIGETENEPEQVVELCCNIDDMTPEEMGYATEEFMKEGALDVCTTSIGMKKSRNGIMLTVMCRPEDKEKFTSLIFKHTTTIGIRQYVCERMTLNRQTDIVNTKYGDIRLKKTEGYGVQRIKVEYEDIKKIAGETGRSLLEIREELRMKSEELRMKSEE